MSKDLYIEISAHFGIESVENLVVNRRNRFINRYGEADNVALIGSFACVYFYLLRSFNFCLLNLLIYFVLSYHIRW